MTEPIKQNIDLNVFFIEHALQVNYTSLNLLVVFIIGLVVIFLVKVISNKWFNNMSEAIYVKGMKIALMLIMLFVGFVMAFGALLVSKDVSINKEGLVISFWVRGADVISKKDVKSISYRYYRMSKNNILQPGEKPSRCLVEMELSNQEKAKQFIFDVDFCRKFDKQP